MAGKLAITKAEQASFWEWDLGSALFFWRWPEHYQDIARKGIAPMFDSAPPRSKERQLKYHDEAIRKKVREKLDKVLAKGYIELIDIELVESIMYMFHVAKGDDIRMVYDGSKSGSQRRHLRSMVCLTHVRVVDPMGDRWLLAC